MRIFVLGWTIPLAVAIFDLLSELPEPVANPALMAARLAAKVSLLMHGRKVDVLIAAPNLMRYPSTTLLSRRKKAHITGVSGMRIN